MVLPSIVILGLFAYYPIYVAVIRSFQSFNPFTQAVTGFVGVTNYKAIFADPAFRQATVNTILYIAYSLLFQVPVALVLAVLINRRLPGSDLVRIAVLATLAASETVSVLVWNQMYEPSEGLLNGILRTIGLPSQGFVSSSHEALISVVFMTAWKNIGLPTIIFLAGLQNIPTEVVEASALDGAGTVKRFRFITVPLLRRSTVVVLFVATVAGSRVFTPLILMTQGGPNNSSTNMIYYAYQQAFSYSSYGSAAAAVVCMLVLFGAITALQFWALRRA